jgi:hypothetical protein
MMLVGSGAMAGGPNRPGLSKADRALVAQASAEGQSSVTLLIGTDLASSAATISALQSLGGTVAYSNQSLGYAEIQISPDKAAEAAKVAGVMTANVDVPVPAVVPAVDADTPSLDPVPNPGPLNAYMPTGDIGAQQFVAAHPTYDGRGVKVGIVDTGVDLDRPELKTALDKNGKVVPKIYDWITTTQPRLTDAANGDPTWVPMTAAAPAGSSITIGTTSYSLPAGATGPFQVGVFDATDPRIGGELNFVLDPAHQKFGVLQSGSTVWVDTNDNKSFADETAMTDYRKNLDVGHFGVDNPASSNAVETMPFTVQTDTPGFVNIGIISEGHGTHVAGTVAGKDFMGGKFNGVAPNAQLAVARVCLFITGCFTSDQNDAFIRLITEDKVDVIQMSIGGLAALNDGQSTSELLVNRLTRQYGVQFVFSQGNSGPGANTAGSPGTADLVIGVGAYQSRDTWIANYNNHPPKQDTMWAFSSRGPREDGGLKPQVVAPGSELSTWPAWDPGITEASARPYNLPPGYGMIQGTSMASPMVAGSVALLLSAAQQTSGLKDVTPAQIRKSLFSSARYLPAYGAYEQGNGLVQVGAAWDLLKQNPNVASIASMAPVKTTISQFLLTPNVGQGIYEREGWVAGQTGSRTITFTRDPDRDAMGDKDLGAADHDRGNHNGWRNQSATYNVILKGNDGTFSAPSTITIAPGGTASLPVQITPASAGIHSALVILDDPSSPGYEYETEATVIAADQFSEAGNFSVAHPGESDKAGFKAFFFNVAPNTPAFKVDLAVINGRARIDAFDPWGLPVSPASAVFTNTGTTVSRTFANPKPGVWEIDIEASRADVSGALVLPDVTTYTVTASELGVSIDPASWTIPTTALGAPNQQVFTFKNLFGAFSGRSVGTAVGSAHDATPTANAGGAQQQTAITVPAGASNLTVTIGNASDPNADLDLYLFNCTAGLDKCVQAGSSAGSTANEAVSVNNPAAGTWVAVVDLFAIPSGTTTYAYEDIYSKTGLGSITSSEGATNTTRAHNETWTANVTATATSVPTAGRILKGAVQVRTSAGAVLGSAPISILAVTP